MAILDEKRRQVEQALDKYCRGKVAARLADKLRLGYTFRGNRATMFEELPGLVDQSEWVKVVVAQFQYDPPTGGWSFDCAAAILDGTSMTASTRQRA